MKALLNSIKNIFKSETPKAYRPCTFKTFDKCCIGKYPTTMNELK
jgi:hypothetical protein